MSSALEQRFPDSVFLRNTKGERARFKKANLGNRNWAGWVHLQSYGKAPAVLVSDLKVGDYILYNYGYKSQVKSITPKGKASVVVETESAKDGKLYDRTYRLKSLIPILSDRQIQIHQRLKSKGYAAESFGAETNKKTVKEIATKILEKEYSGLNPQKVKIQSVKQNIDSIDYTISFRRDTRNKSVSGQLNQDGTTYDYENREARDEAASKITRPYDYLYIKVKRSQKDAQQEGKNHTLIDNIIYECQDYFIEQFKDKGFSGGSLRQYFNPSSTRFDYGGMRGDGKLFGYNRLKVLAPSFTTISYHESEDNQYFSEPDSRTHRKIEQIEKTLQEKFPDVEIKIRGETTEDRFQNGVVDVLFKVKLKDKGYAAETKTKNKRKRQIKFGLAEDLIDDASDYYNKCLNRDGYHPEDEDEEHIVDLCREAEALARSIGLDVEYRPYMNRLGISDLDDQLYEEGKEAGLESALMVTSFGADEEFYGEYPAKYYQTDEDEGVFYLPATDSYWVVQGEDALTKEQSKELAFGAEAGTYRINWNDGEEGVVFDFEGGDDMQFDDEWTDLFWDASEPVVTKETEFNAVVIAPEQPKGSVEKALMNHYLFQESAMRQALMEIENRVELGMMSVEEAERKLNRLIQQKMRSENYASENTSKKLLSGVFMLVAVASLWRAVTVTEDTYLFPKENKYMTILGSASIGLGILAWKGDSILAALED